MHQYNIIGLMSGTSLDGLDIVCCQFSKQENRWNYRLLAYDTIDYPHDWKETLPKLMKVSGQELHKADTDYGIFLGEAVNSFIATYKLEVDFIASHGHTIFHQPDKGYGLQIGKGEAIYATCSIPTIYDFRALDIALGGQGAPLVPIGDLHLFSEYDYCLNLGGIANISKKTEKGIIAYDICPCNIILNHLSQKINLAYDEGGQIARKGKIIPSMIDTLNRLPFYLEKPPKSLGREWIDTVFIPILETYDMPIEDCMRSCVEHIAIQIAHGLHTDEHKKLLLSGGGAFNDYLVERMKHHGGNVSMVVPSEEVIAYKEAIIFAFLGLLKVEKLPNCLASVTGAIKDSSGGKIIGI